jgi:hypothetical protein
MRSKSRIAASRDQPTVPTIAAENHRFLPSPAKCAADVEATASEMWSHFGETAYFPHARCGRTDGETSALRLARVHAPFNAKGATLRPSKLVVNVQLPGKGSVFLRNLKLVQSELTVGGQINRRHRRRCRRRAHQAVLAR